MSSLATQVTQRGPAKPAQGAAAAAKLALSKRTAVKSPAHPPSAAPVIAKPAKKALAVKSSPAVKPLPPAAGGHEPSMEDQEGLGDAYMDEAQDLAAEMRGLEEAITAAEDPDSRQAEVAMVDSYYGLHSAEQIEEEGSEVEEVVIEDSEEETSKHMEEPEEADFGDDSRDEPVPEKPITKTEHADGSRETKMQLLRQRLMKAQHEAETQRRTLGLGPEDLHQDDSESRAQDVTQSSKVLDDDDVPPGVLGDDTDETKLGQKLHVGEGSHSSQSGAADASTFNTVDTNGLGKLARGAVAKSGAIKPGAKSKSVQSPRMRPAVRSPSKSAVALTGVRLPASVDSTEPAGSSDLGELTQDERALRGLLQFYVCEDARRPTGEEAPLRMKYKDLVSAVCTSAGASTKGKAESAGSAADAKAGSASTAGRERLKRQLMEKQQQLAQEVKHRRQQLAQVSVGSAVSSTRPLEPTMQKLATRPEREAVLRRNRDEAVDAAMDAEKLRARKTSLEEVQERLRSELARIRQDKLRAARQVEEARAEERRVLERLRQQAKSSSFGGSIRPTGSAFSSASILAGTVAGTMAATSTTDTATAIVGAAPADAPETLLQAQ